MYIYATPLIAVDSPGVHIVKHACCLNEERANAGGLDIRVSKDFQLQTQRLIKANLQLCAQVCSEIHLAGWQCVFSFAYLPLQIYSHSNRPIC